jgi:hypothetical protein
VHIFKAFFTVRKVAFVAGHTGKMPWLNTSVPMVWMFYFSVNSEAIMRSSTTAEATPYKW